MNRFDDSQPQVGSPDPEERLELTERVNRRLHEANPWGVRRPPKPADGATAEERERAYRDWLAKQGLKHEDDASTDAIASVEYRDDEWVVRWVLAEQGGVPIVRGVSLEPLERTTPAGGVTANLLRDLRPSRALRDAATELAEDPQERAGRDTSLDQLFIRFARRAVREADFPEPPRKQPGRPKLSEEHLARVAAAYLDELPRGRGVLRRLGERFDRTPEAMRDQVRAARKAGFLSDDAKPGRRGATPGPRLQVLLRDQDEEQG